MVPIQITLLISISLPTDFSSTPQLIEFLVSTPLRQAAASHVAADHRLVQQPWRLRRPQEPARAAAVHPRHPGKSSASAVAPLAWTPAGGAGRGSAPIEKLPVLALCSASPMSSPRK
jgi:hypothetical protein